MAPAQRSGDRCARTKKNWWRELDPPKTDRSLFTALMCAGRQVVSLTYQQQMVEYERESRAVALHVIQSCIQAWAFRHRARSARAAVIAGPPGLIQSVRTRGIKLDAPVPKRAPDVRAA